MNKSWIGEFLVAFFWRIPVIIIIYYLLTIPDATSYVKKSDIDDEISYLFDEEVNDVWVKVDQLLKSPRFQVSCQEADSSFQLIKNEATQIVAEVNNSILEPDDANILLLENYLMEMGAYTYYCPELYEDFIAQSTLIITSVKSQSIYWDLGIFAAKKRLHNIYAGSRAIIDEILKRNFNASNQWAKTFGVNNDSLRNYDFLAVNRIDPVASIYSTVNLFPGYYSNILALYQTDSSTELPDQYLEIDYLSGSRSGNAENLFDHNFSRIALCRLDQLETDIIPQPAPSNETYQYLANSNTPFDFTGDMDDSDMLYDYEMASLLSEQREISLNGGISSFENEHLKFWLSQIGMEHFDYNSPSDLIYDRSILVLKEWVHPGLLVKEHINRASMEKIMELSLEDSEIPFRRWYLPVERFRKGYSMIRQLNGKSGSIPYALNSTESLKVKSFQKGFERLNNFLRNKVDTYISNNSRPPTYIEIREMASKFDPKLY